MTFNNELIEVLETEYEVNVYRDYSGRGMFGDTCFGIICGRSANSEMHKFYCAMHELAVIEDPDYASVKVIAGEFWNNTDLSVAQDSLGLDLILYFPGIHCESMDE